VQNAGIARAAGRRNRPLPLLTLFVATAAGAGACRTGASGGARPGPVPSPAAAPAVARVASNVLRGDYAGSARCEGCHAKIYAAWQGSPMHRMTRLPVGDAIAAPFAGETFRFKDDGATLQQQDGVRFVRINSREYGEHVYRVTRVIGGRYREDYAGIEVPAPDPHALPVVDPLAPQRRAAELILPVSFLLQSRSYRLKGYSVMVGERPGMRAGGVWSETCIFCHNTVPYFDAVWGALRGRGAAAYQGEVVDRLLPRARRWAFSISDDQALADAVAAEVAFVGGGDLPASSGGAGARAQMLDAAIPQLRRRFGGEHLIEIGIGCEACHGGSAQHARQPSVLPDLEPRAAFVSVDKAGAEAPPARAEWINRTCARCHQVLFSRYPFTWEGGRRNDRPGGSHITSGEARDFLLSKCSRAMACTACHDPHGADAPERLARLATPAGNGACTGCHDQLATAQALRAHAHHDPAGAGGSCVACHMPRKNMGLGTSLTRYHRIGSPTDDLRLGGDRPIECALCHAGKSVGQVVNDIARLWERRIDRVKLEALYGPDENRNMLIATVERGRPHEQVPAIVALGEQRVAGATMAVAAQVLNPYPLVRPYALRALEALTGRACAVDLDRGAAEIAAALERCVPGAARGRAADRAPPSGSPDGDED